MRRRSAPAGAKQSAPRGSLHDDGERASTLIASIQSVILIPLHIAHIGPRLYGAWLGSGDILVWMQAFDFGLPNLMIQRIGEAHGRGDAAQVAEIERQLRDARHNAALRVEVEYRESANREAMLKKAVAETKPSSTASTRAVSTTSPSSARPRPIRRSMRN